MESILEAKSITKYYDFRTVLESISVQIFPGEVIALLGRSGAGKSTLMEMLYGQLASPAEGEVSIFGVPVDKPDNAMRQKVAFVPQKDDLLNRYSGNEHCALFSTYREHWDPNLAYRLSAEWEIPMDRPVSKLSVGQRQKLSILLGICSGADLLFLDEPVASLDPISRRHFLQALVEVTAHEHKSVIFSTHIVTDVERVASHVWMLNNKRLVCQAEVDDLKESVVRLSYASDTPLMSAGEKFIIHKQKTYAGKTVATLLRWREEFLEPLQARMGVSIFVENLSLEDIFLELNT